MLTLEEKNAWAAELRSGKYKQIFGMMTDHDRGRCALGVLCEVLNIEITYHSENADMLIDKGVGTGIFMVMNDINRISFPDIADKIDSYPLNHHSLNCVRSRSSADR